MVQTVRIPLSWANNIPGVAGIEDVVFDVPEVPDIGDEIEDRLPDLDSIERAVDRNVPDIDEIVEDVRAEIDDALADLEVPGVDQDQLLEDLLDGIEDELPELTVDVDGIAEAVADRLSGELSGGTIDLDALADDIAAQLDTDGAVAPQVNVSGVFGPLTNDIVQAFNRILDERVQAPDVDIPSVEDVRTAVREEVEDVLEAVPGSDLLFDPDQFVDDQIDRLTEGLVDEETRQRASEEFGGDS